MKVLLLRDIPKLGKKGQEVEASDGYARNFLLRQNLAVQAGTAISRRVEQEIRTSVKQTESNAKQQRKLFDKLQGMTLNARHEANDQGHLFAAVSPQEISKILEKALHVKVEPDRIETEKPIKSTGLHRVVLVMENRRAEFQIEVVSKS